MVRRVGVTVDVSYVFCGTMLVEIAGNSALNVVGKRVSLAVMREVKVQNGNIKSGILEILELGNSARLRRLRK